MQSSKSLWAADLILVVTTIIAAAGWLFSKEGLVGLTPLWFISLRFLIAGVVLVSVSPTQIRALGTRNVLDGCLVGALLALAMGLWITGLAHCSHLGEGAFIGSLGSVFVPVVGRLFFGERPSANTWKALPVGVAGLACLSLAHGFEIEAAQWYFLAAAVVFAVLFNVSSRVVRNVSVRALSAIQVLMVGLLILPAAVAFEPWPKHIPNTTLGWLAASAILATSVRFMLQLRGQSLSNPSHAANIMMLEPIWTGIAAALWFGERMSQLQLVGCFLIFSSLLISRWKKLPTV